MKVFCIIPAWNEEKTIVKVLKSVKDLVDVVVVVDDKSGDNTVKLAKEQNVVVLKHIINRGQGASLQTGNNYAVKNDADIIVHFDADGQFLAKDIPRLIQPIMKDSVDIVFGSRFLEKKSKIPKFKEYVIMPIAHLVNRMTIGETLTDPQSGFRAMTIETVSKINITNSRMAHCSEILHKAFKYNLRIKEVPITVIYNDFGQNFLGGIRIVKDLLITKILN